MAPGRGKQVMFGTRRSAIGECRVAASAGLDAAVRADAVVLLVERAADARPDFVLDEHNVDAVVHVCARLDGIVRE
jgi:predicted ATPase